MLKAIRQSSPAEGERAAVYHPDLCAHPSPSAVSPSLLPWLRAVVCCLCVLPLAAQAEIKIVSAEGEHVLGQHDTKEEAIRLATEAAKRDALEQVATYLESVTVSTGTSLTQDEIRTYTAGVVNVIDHRVALTAAGGTVTVHVDLTAQIDTDEVAEAIKKLREQQDVREELSALKAEVDQLQRELDQANQTLAMGLSPTEVQSVTDRRAGLLNQMQSNLLVQQAWMEWVIGGPYVWPYGTGYPYGVSVPTLLAWAGQLNPNNPHVPTAGTIITARTGAPLPPAPPVPPAPPGYAGAIPPHQQLVAPLPVPTNAAIGTVPPATSPQRLHSLFPPGTGGSAPHGQSPAGGSTRRLGQFLPPPGYRAPTVPPGGWPSSVPPSTQRLPSVSAVPPTYHPDPQSSRSFSRLQQTFPGAMSRTAPAPTTSGHTSPPSAGRSGGPGGR